MASYNSVTLLGNLTRDPELSYTPNNVAVCKFGIATNHKYKDKEEVCFVDCTVWAKQAEAFNQYMKKGQPVLIEGRLQFQQWTGADNQKKSKHAIVVNRFTFVGGKPDGNGQAPDTQPAPGAGAAPKHQQTTDDFPDDDVPF